MTYLFRYFFAAVTSAAVLCVFVIITSIIFLAGLYSGGIPVDHPFLPINDTTPTPPELTPPESKQTKVRLHFFIPNRFHRYTNDHFNTFALIDHCILGGIDGCYSNFNNSYIHYFDIPFSTPGASYKTYQKQ